MIVGDRDLRTTTSQAEEFYQALQLANKPTELAIIPGASHGIFAPSQMIAQTSAILAWFARYKAGSAAVAVGEPKNSGQ
jgi:dipeptidyl aminopeptidase/acylaminoacyl peptidase